MSNISIGNLNDNYFSIDFAGKTDPTDTYRFNRLNTGSFRVTAEGFSSIVGMQLLDSQGKVVKDIETNGTNSGTFSIDNLGATNYALKISAPSRDTNYQVSLTPDGKVDPLTGLGVDSGFFATDSTGQVGFDWLHDGGSYQGEVAIFSVLGMEKFTPGSQEFIKEAARRSLTNSTFGHVVISDPTEGANPLFNGSLGEANYNEGQYSGAKRFPMKPGEVFAVMLVPNGTVQDLFKNPGAGGDKRPLLSLSSTNPDDAWLYGQIADVTGSGKAFAMEDQRVDQGSDKDYNDLVFNLTGATGKAVSIDKVIDPAKDWTKLDGGKKLIDYVKSKQPVVEPPVAVAPPIETKPPVAVAPPVETPPIDPKPPVAVAPPVETPPIDPKPPVAVAPPVETPPIDPKPPVAVAPPVETPPIDPKPPVETPAVETPPIDPKPPVAVAPPVETPPVETKPPVAVAPPVETPPIDPKPPVAVAPPVETPPIDPKPPVETPAVETPPIDPKPPVAVAPPVETPPIETKPPVAVAPPVETPPVETKPPVAVAPPVETPPVETKPPVAVAPPVETPPIDPKPPVAVAPPVTTPPVETKPPVAVAPPVETPPIDPKPPVAVAPPVETPPIDPKPPVAVAPPVETPPIDPKPPVVAPPVAVTPPVETAPPVAVTPPVATLPIVPPTPPVQPPTIAPEPPLVELPIDPEPPIETVLPISSPPENHAFIGIIDTGFAANNPDLDYSKVTLGRDRIDKDSNPLFTAGTGNEHGTFSWGLVSAIQGNDKGIDGYNDKANVYLSRAIGSGEWDLALTDFVGEAKAQKKKNAIALLPLDLTQKNADGSITTRYEFTNRERAALENARQNGVLLVVAAGNDGGVMSVLGQSSQEFENILTVGSSDGFGRSDYSSYGYGLDILVPGGTIDNPTLSTVGDDLGTMAGTSASAAIAAGMASKVWESNPDLNPTQIIDILTGSAIDLKEPGWDQETGFGVVNLNKAVQVAKETAPESYTPTPFLNPTTWGLDGQVSPWERATYDLKSGDFTSIIWSTNGVTLRNSTNLSDKSNLAVGYQETLSFDAWTYGEAVADLTTNEQDALWFRTNVNGQSYWVPSAYTKGYPPGNPPLLPPANSDPGLGDSGTTNPGSSDPGTTNPGSGDPGTTNPGSGDPGTTNPPPPSSISLNGHTIGGNFYPVFQNYQGTLGNPTSDVFTSGGASYQLFENGSIVSSANGTFPLYGGIRQEFLNTGGLNGRLGAPTSEEKNLGGNIVQYFEHGHIYWNGSKATAYDEGAGLPSVSLPSNQPISGKGVTIRTGDSGSSGNITLIGGGVRGFEDRDVDGRNNFYPDSVLDLHPANLKDTPSTPNQPWDNPSELTENPMFRELMSYLVGNKVAAETLDKPPINVLTSGYLDRYYDDRFLGYYFHSGFDMAIADGAKVSALTGGEVISAGTSTENAVAIHNADLGKTFLYLHMRNVQVTKGQTIAPGTWIGNVSDKGTEPNIHLHFEVHEDQELQQLTGNPYDYKDGVVANIDKKYVRDRTLNPLNAFMEAQLTGKTVVSPPP